MTVIRLQDGKPIVEDGKVGTEQECCCEEQGCCEKVTWHRVHGECNNLEDDFVTVDVGEDCYAYYTWDDWSCDNDIVGRDCGDPEGNCDIFARVKVTATASGAIAGVIEYLQSPVDEPEVWGPEAPGGRCDCPDSFGSLSVVCKQCECPNECVENLAISLGGNPACFGGVYSDFLACVGGGGISAVLQCNDGQWLVFVSVCCFENGGVCLASYEAVLECEADNLPPAGAVGLIETGFFEDGGGCPPLPPTVTIIK